MTAISRVTVSVIMAAAILIGCTTTPEPPQRATPHPTAVVPEPTPTVDTDLLARTVACDITADILEEDSYRLEGTFNALVAAAEAGDPVLLQIHYSQLAVEVPAYLNLGGEFVTECYQIADDPMVVVEIRSALQDVESYWRQMKRTCEADLAEIGIIC